ncbi:MAG: hypothetical protein VKP62_13835, partial [Candidatus Sericytochromatia bacterium]|nr:hypothetical protein [Candidatus Sericytochromatia bacterium]
TYKVKNDPPTYPMGTSPLIDVSGSRKRVYVFNANTLFSLDFTSPKTWTDTDYSPGQSTAGTKYSRFNEGSLGRAGSAGGTMTDTKTRYLRNTITPVLNFDLSALYAVCYYPDTGVYNDTLFKVAVNKFTLPINESTSADRLSASAPSTTTSDAIATGTTAIAAENSVHNGNSVSANVGNRLLSIDPLATNGANDGIYLGLAGTKALYRFQL